MTSTSRHIKKKSNSAQKCATMGTLTQQYKLQGLLKKCINTLNNCKPGVYYYLFNFQPARNLQTSFYCFLTASFHNFENPHGIVDHQVN